jgi:hypothetical protein
MSQRYAHIARLGTVHEARLAGLLCSLDAPSRVNRFGHPLRDACEQAYAKCAICAAAFVARALVEGTLIGVVEVFKAGRDGTAEMAFR